MGALIDTFQYFSSLNKIEYQFDVSISRKLRTLIIDFDEADFYHIGGFQHLGDIALDKHTKVFIQKIKNGLITDEYLSKSIYYSPISYEEKSGIKDRIDEINNLEYYLESENVIMIYENNKNRSLIDADYFIKCIAKDENVPVYIFLRKRKEKDTYCIVSLFKEKTKKYYGSKLYWMQKVKRCNGHSTVLFIHPGFKDEQ